MKFRAWQTSTKAPDITEAHLWRQSRIIRNQSVSLCWLLVSNKSLRAADEKTTRCSVCEELERGR